MSCPKSLLLSAYHDNELRGADKTGLEAHMAGCGACSAALAEMRTLNAAFGKAERYAAPPGFAARVTARAAEPDKKRPPWFIPVLAGLAEAAVLVLVVTVGVFAGTVMMNGSAATERTANLAALFSLDLFDGTPTGSLGSAYLAMTEAGNEK